MTNPSFKAYVSLNLTVCSELVSMCAGTIAQTVCDLAWRVGLEVVDLPPDIRERPHSRRSAFFFNKRGVLKEPFNGSKFVHVNSFRA